MFVVTITNLWLKSYLSFVKWVADKMRSLNTLAIALNRFMLFFYKKINEKVYSFLETLITNSSSSAKIVQDFIFFR